jgi:hypothetical protein
MVPERLELSAFALRYYHYLMVILSEDRTVMMTISTTL